MRPLFSEAGLARLDEIAVPGLLCAFDFDGTLAPIVPEPDRAALPATILERLQRLSGHAPIAIVTGRALRDIRERLDFTPDFIVGNHGAEGVPGWESRAAGHLQLCAQWRAQLERALDGRADATGIAVEDKRFSLSVHYRAAPDPEAAGRRLHEVLLALSPPPRIVSGKCVFNVVPADAPHKGDAMRELLHISSARAALYAGDDVTDEDVFRTRLPEMLTVRVERHADSAADFYVAGPGDMAALLDALIERLSGAGARNWIGMQPGTRA